MADGFSTSKPGQPAASCPLKNPPPKPVHWIEIQLVDEDDKGVEGEEYKLVLPDGTEVHGYLDEKGWARVPNIEQDGACKLTFPRLDTDAWKFIKQAGALTGTGK